MKAVVLVAAVHLLTLAPASPSPPEDSACVGCYSTVSATIQISKSFLSWKQCLYLCSHRGTRYAAVQSEPKLSDSTYNLCYCLDHLEELSGNVSSTLCQPCLENNEKFCGGNKTVSVYQLCDTECTVLLLATSQGLVRVSGNSTVTLEGFNFKVETLDYHYLKDGVIFLSYYNFWSLFYNPIKMKYGDVHVTSQNYFSIFYDLTVDWLHNTTYCNNHKGVQSSSLLGKNASQTYIEGRGVDLKIDPYRGLLFYIKCGKLLSSRNESVFTKEYTIGSETSEKCHRLALDVGQRIIYVLCEEWEQYNLLRVDYDDENLRLLFTGPQLSNPTAFDAYNGEVFWVNQHSEQRYVLYRCKLNPGCLPQNVQTVLEISEKVNDLKIYHPQEITFNPCASLNCSYNCTTVSPDKGQCTCPETLHLAADNRTCQDTITTTTAKGLSSQEPMKTKTTEDKDAFSQGLRISKTSETEESSKEEQSSTLLSDKKHRDHGLAETAPTTTIRTTVMKEQPRQETKSTKLILTIFELYMFGVIVTLLLCLIYLLYLHVKSKRPNGQFGPSYVPALECSCQQLIPIHR